jgi:hypothetical protein
VPPPCLRFGMFTFFVAFLYPVLGVMMRWTPFLVLPIVIRLEALFLVKAEWGLAPLALLLFCASARLRGSDVSPVSKSQFRSPDRPTLSTSSWRL